MRNAFLGFVLAVLGGALTSQAVVISWASESLPAEATSARLVYITDGTTPTYSGGSLQGGVELATASGAAIDGSFLYEQTTTDGTTRNSGAYYIVLFNSDASQYAVGSPAIAYNDSGLGTSEMDPGTTFSASSFGSWAPVPEPSAAALLGLGAAALALRRRKRA
jgi:hypothetical protein